MLDFRSDIPLTLATSAHGGTSFDPDLRGTQEIEGYASTLAGDFANLEKHAPTDEKRATLAEEFDRYRAGYKRRMVAYLAARSRCLSSMIAGPSNFPTRRMEKRSGVADKRLTELVEFRERALAAIRRALHPELRPIMAGDSDATSRLTAKLAKAEADQARMKAANAAIRKHVKAGPDAQIAALVALGYPNGIARQLIVPDYAGRVGFPDFEIKNNGAEIRRLRARMVGVERSQALPDAATDGANARIEDSPSDNRVRLFFPGKPDADTRERLKRGGFRWSPTLGCWQAYRNHNALELAKVIAA